MRRTRLNHENHEPSGYNYGGESLNVFARRIRDGMPYPIAVDDVLHGAAVLEAAIQSAAIRKPVQFKD